MDRVLVTGVTGYIGRHVARALLERGFAVRGSLRDPARGQDVAAALESSGVDVSALSFVPLDLEREEGFAEAVADCRFVAHVASPFPMEQPSDREALVPAARAGTLRVLRAALDAGVEHIALTSSIAAMMYRPGRPQSLIIREQDWTDPEWSGSSAYTISKTRAELAAWELADERGARQRLTTVNPGLVLGPLLGAANSTSVEALALLLRGAYPAVPPIAFPIVDVRDVARVHVEALVRALGGRRLLTAGETLTFRQMALTLREGRPELARRVPTRELPRALVRLVALFDARLRVLLPDLGVVPQVDPGPMTALTGVTLRSARECLLDTVDSLAESGRI
jgi:dihydroflavonol-4-reductase